MKASLNKQELKELGLKSYGKNVLISRKASIYNPQNISIGDNVRIDDFVILSSSSELNIGSYVHISCYVSILGKGKVTLEDFSGLSGRVSVYSSNDDYLGRGMTNPTVPDEYKKVTHGDVLIKKHAIVGSGSVILPNTTLNDGVAIGALSLAQGEYESFSIYIGSPAEKKGRRRKTILDIEKKLMETLKTKNHFLWDGQSLDL